MFGVTEKLDGTTHYGGSISAPVNITLVTDYNSMRWMLDFNFDSTVAGGPTQPFETRLSASGSFTTKRCFPGCSPTGLGEPSTFTFPDAFGNAAAGSYAMVGTTKWKLTDRIVNVLRERESPSKAAMWSGDGTMFSTGSHSLSVKNYPNSIQLTNGFEITPSLVQRNGQWEFRLGTSLGVIIDGNNSLEVTLTSLPHIVTLTERLPGDFNDSASVDAADYVTWRNGGGVLSGFLSSYDAWRSNFGDVISASSGQSSVPEPATVLLIIGAAFFISLRRPLR
jgi:hypothetical protein